MKSFLLNRKLKASALYVVVSISVIAGLILLGLVFTAGIYSKEKGELNIRNQLILNTKSALQYCLASPDLLNNEVVDLYKEQRDSVYFQNSPFGILSYVNISAFHGKDTIRKTFLLGNKSNKKSSTAIFLSNSNKSLGLCGKSLLNGDVFVPEKGVDRLYIEGQNFVGSKLFYGENKISTADLPDIHPNILKNIIDVYQPKEGIPFPSDLDTITSSNQTIYFLEQSDLFLSQYISGNICIESKTKIIVSKEAKLENIILKAPTVVFESGFKGRVQVFVTDSLITGRECNFLFPSFFVLKHNQNNDFSTKIELGEKSNLLGNIVLLQDKFHLKNNGMITINKNCIVNGTIYSKGYTQLKHCEIQGDVYTKKLYLKTASSIYENTLLNVKIDPEKKDTNMIDLGIDKTNRSWIYLK